MMSLPSTPKATTPGVKSRQTPCKSASSMSKFSSKTKSHSSSKINLTPYFLSDENSRPKCVTPVTHVKPLKSCISSKKKTDGNMKKPSPRTPLVNKRLDNQTPQKKPVNQTPKVTKNGQKSPVKCTTPIKEGSITVEFSSDIVVTPMREAKTRTLSVRSLSQVCLEPSSEMRDRLNRSHSSSSIFGLRPKSSEDGTPMSRMKRSISEAKLSLQSSCPPEAEGESSRLTVGVRVRPLQPREGVNGVTVSDKEIRVASDLGSEHSFKYDYCFSSMGSQAASQEEVYEVLVRPLLDNAFQGYNACLFAYGQTGSGKTYSMMGPVVEGGSPSVFAEAGMIPRFCKDLLQKTSALEEACPSVTTSVEISYLEVYNEKIHDLLVPGSAQLRVREHPVYGPYVVDLSRHTVNTFSDFQHWLSVGNKKRVTAATEANDKSSRSHSLFTIILTQTFAQVRSDGSWSHDQTRRSQINLVDLAGSERIAHTSVTTDRLREGVSINRSLLTLGKVMSALVDRRGFVPYRESVLTWLLKESLGGNARTCMLATISPCSAHLDETLATLRYASQARSIVNRVRVNEAPQDREIRQLREELDKLRSASTRLTTLLDEKEEVENQLKKSKEDIERLEADLNDCRCKLVEAEQIKLNMANVLSVNKTEGNLLELIASMECDIGNKKLEFDQLLDNREELTKKLAESVSREEKLGHKLEELSNLECKLEVKQSELKLYESQLSASLEIEKELRKKLSESYTKEETLTNELNDIRGVVSKLKTELRETSLSKDSLEKKLAESCKKCEEMKLEAARGSVLENEIKKLEGEVRKFKRHLAEIGQREEHLIEELRVTKLEIRKNKSMLNEADERKEELSKMLIENGKKLEELRLQAGRAPVLEEDLKKLEGELRKCKCQLSETNYEKEKMKKQLHEFNSREEKIKLQAQQITKLQAEMGLIENELKKCKDNLYEANECKKELSKKLEECLAKESGYKQQLGHLGSLNADLEKLVDELKKTKFELTEANRLQEEMRKETDEQLRRDEVERCRLDLGEMKERREELRRRLAESSSREEVLRVELASQTIQLERAQAQVAALQRFQEELMEEKLTIIKVMEKQCLEKEIKENTEDLLSENRNIKNELKLANEKLSKKINKIEELKKRIVDLELLLKTAITHKNYNNKLETVEKESKEIYESIMEAAFPHHFVHLIRKARTFTETYKIPYDIESGDKMVIIKNLLLRAKATLSHLQLSKWVERIETEKTWYKTMDRDLPWEVDFGDYYEKNDVHKVVLEDPTEADSAINIGTKLTCSGCINPVLWRKTMIKRHVMGLKEDSEVLIQYFNETEDSRIYSILTRIQAAVTRLKEATENIEK